MNTALRLAAAILLIAPAMGVQAAERVWDFEVQLDGKPIGSHRFVLEEHNDERVLTSSADFNVRFLGFVAYRYHHQDVERWRGECLSRMDASTLDDGKPTRVQARTETGGLRIEINGAAAVPQPPAPACLMSFAYWNPALRSLAPTRLLNAQNGRVETTQITRLADASIDVRGAPQAAQHWRITGVDAPIELWYSDSGDWLALESQVRGGRTLQYRLK